MADEREEEEGGFTVRDRRRFLTEDTPSEPTSIPTSPVNSSPLVQDAPEGSRFETIGNLIDAPESDDTYGGDPEAQETNELPDIYSVVAIFLGEMRSHAILRLGLAPNPMTGQSEQDLAQAKIAIDTAVFLGSQLESVLTAEEKLPLHAMLSELQMLFVEQSKKA
jgi:hypothetical protein